MAGNLKSDITNGAFSILRISGLTVIPGPEDNTLALERLEEMAAELFESNIDAGYNFEENPDINSDSGLERKFRLSFKRLLAKYMLSDYGKGLQPDPILMADASYSLSFLSARTALIKQVQAPRTMPTGSGNRYNEYWKRYNYPQAEAPLSAATNGMKIGEIDDFTEDFTSYLIGTEDITSYELQVSYGLLIVSTSLSTPIINYRLQAIGDNERSPGGFCQVKIIATTTIGRIKTRVINFSLSSDEDLIGGDGDIMIGVTFLYSLQTADADQTIFTAEFNVNQVFLDQVLMTTGYSGQGTETITLDAGLYEGQEVYLTT